jgi:hypothetical protein
MSWVRQTALIGYSEEASTGGVHRVTVGSTVAIVPAFGGAGATYTCSDSSHWTPSSGRWLFSPAFDDGGTIINVTFTCSGVSRTDKVVVFRDFSKLVAHPGNPITLTNEIPSNAGSTDTSYVRTTYKIGDTYYSITQGASADGQWKYFNLYTSPDMIAWAIHPSSPVLTAGPADNNFIIHPCIIKMGDLWYLYCSNGARILLATSPDFINWAWHANSPVYTGNPAGEQSASIPNVLMVGGALTMYYWTGDTSADRVVEMEYATATPDGLTWTYGGSAINRLPTDWDYGSQYSGYDPWVIENDRGFYEMVHTEMSPTGHQRHGYAVSEDGHTWYKFHGPILSPSGVAGTWNQLALGDGCLVVTGDEVRVYCVGESATAWQGGLYTMSDPNA